MELFYLNFVQFIWDVEALAPLVLEDLGCVHLCLENFAVEKIKIPKHFRPMGIEALLTFEGSHGDALSLWDF